MLKSLCFFIFLFTAFLSYPCTGQAFFTDSKIEIVQEGFFESHKESLKNILIEDALMRYNYCKNSEWDTYTNEKNEEIVTFKCNYASAEAIRTNLKALGVLDVKTQEEVIMELEDRDFSLDLLLFFKVNESQKDFSFLGMEYLYNDEKVGGFLEQNKTQILNILEDKPLTLSLIANKDKAFAEFSYALEKVILSSEKEYKYAAPFFGDLGFTYNVKNAPILTATLSDLDFDDENMRIMGKLAFTLQYLGKKIDVQKEKGYFLKYFKAALASSPQILQSEKFDVYFRKNSDELTHFLFENKDQTFTISFEKKSLATLAPEAIKIQYNGNINQEVKDFVKKIAEISASPQGISNELLGNYVYESEGMKGSVRIRQDEKLPNSVHVFLNTVNVQALHLCDYEGICTFSENKYVCPIKDAPEGMEAFFEIVPSDNGFNIPQNPSLLCGARGFMSGDYSRCTEQTNGPLTMIVVPMEIIHEDDTYIVRFTDDGAESLEFVSQKQAEFLEDMIGKNVLVHYNQSQIWNTEKNFCNRSKEIISVEDATRPEAKLLGGYSHINPELKGYAFIEPDFTAKSAFNIHLNNYSNDLEKNCQFAGECYAEGKGFICNTFDKEQNPDEYFEIIPSNQGFLVINNATNTCVYTGFMAGRYDKCDNKVFSNSSISGKLIAVNEEDFMYPHVIILSEGIEVDMRIGIDQIALAKSLLNQDVFVSFVDEQYWGEHDRACVREKRVTRLQTILAVKNSLLGNYIHNADGINGSAIISEVENAEDSFFLTLKNEGLISKVSCPFSGICRSAKNGFICQSLGASDKSKTFVTVIPNDDGFSIPFDISYSCKMRSLNAGSYSKCTKKKIGSSSVTGLLKEIREESSQLVEIVMMMQGRKKIINILKNTPEFSNHLAHVKNFLGKNVTVGYTEEQDWDEKGSLCRRLRLYTSIKVVRAQQKP